jgi:hypothetical protein
MTPEVEEKIIRTVALGMYPDRAAEAHGINKATMRAHKKRNPDFATALKEAEATAESGALSAILLHFPRQWTAAAWLLERRWPERWAKRELPPTDAETRDLVMRLRSAAKFVQDLVPETPQPAPKTEEQKP